VLGAALPLLALATTFPGRRAILPG
jgi:hypothetical protein